MDVQFYCIIDRKSTNPAMSDNGGDYDFGRTVVVAHGQPVAVCYWTSAEFDYCPHTGRFNRCEERNGCGDPAPMEPRDVEGWQAGRLLEGKDAEFAVWRWENDPTRFYQVFK